jgi:hypothetical protein
MFAQRWIISLTVGLALASGARAQVVVAVPNVFTNTTGSGLSQVLIGIQGNPRTSQFIWDTNQLTGLIGMEITGVRYRLHTAIPNGYPLQTTTWSDYRISAGPSVTPALATGTYASNFLTPPTLVRSGPLTVPPFAWPTGGSGSNPDPWGVFIPFDTPYIYTGGPLAMLFTHPGSDNPNQGNALLDSTSSSSAGNGVDYTNIGSAGFNATTGASTVFSTIIQLSAVPAPEPTSLVLVGMAGALVIPMFRRSRRRGTLE